METLELNEVREGGVVLADDDSQQAAEAMVQLGNVGFYMGEQQLLQQGITEFKEKIKIETKRITKYCFQMRVWMSIQIMIHQIFYWLDYQHERIKLILRIILHSVNKKINSNLYSKKKTLVEIFGFKYININK